MSKSVEHFPELVLPKPENITLPIDGGPIPRPDADLIDQLYRVGSATASAILHRMGVRQTYIEGPISRTPGRKVVGPAVTLQFMPQREDVASGLRQEEGEKVSALWSVFTTVEPGDILVVQAWGDMHTGCLGEMLATYFKGKGGIGMVVDGCVRDWPNIQQLDVPLWSRGFTPNYASQGDFYPWAYNVPVACSRVLVLPGDAILADDDGAVLIPRRMIPLVLEHTLAHEEWEEFSRMKLEEGGDIYKYYPLSDEGWAEYEVWRAAQE